MQISEVNYKDLDDVIFRLDADYYHPKYLKLEDELKKFDLLSLREVGGIIDCSAFYPSVVPFYNFDGKGVPFLRVNEIQNGLLAITEGTAFLPKSVLEENSSTIARCFPGDLVIAKGGNSLGKVALLTNQFTEYAICRDVLVVRTNKISAINIYYLWMYLHSEIGKSLLLRTASQTGQPHLTVESIYRLEIPCPSIKFQNLFEKIYRDSMNMKDESDKLYAESHEIINDELKYLESELSHYLSFVINFNEVADSGRLDADFFQPKYKKIYEMIMNSKRGNNLSSYLVQNKRGTQPKYNETGFPVINSKHVRACEVIISGNRYAQELNEKTLLIEKGDVLINGTGVGTIGRCAPYLLDEMAIPDNHVTVLKVKNICPIYLSVFINSQFGQMQVEKHFHGSSGQIELYPTDISQFIIWDAPSNVQKCVRQKIEQMTKLRDQSKRILQAAEKSISLALSLSEKSAIEFLDLQ